MNKAIIFLAGVGVGAAGAWYFTKKKYEKYADEEIKDVINRFKKREEQTNTPLMKNNEVSPQRPDMGVYENRISEYSDEELSNGIIDNPVHESEDTDPNEGVAPYIISEEEYGDNEDYDEKTLFWYYRDNILATDEDLEVENIFGTVGEALEEFKKDRYIERVMVRNEQDETDYEILISEKHFYEVTGGDTE